MSKVADHVGEIGAVTHSVLCYPKEVRFPGSSETHWVAHAWGLCRVPARKITGFRVRRRNTSERTYPWMWRKSIRLPYRPLRAILRGAEES